MTIVAFITPSNQPTDTSLAEAYITIERLKDQLQVYLVRSLQLTDYQRVRIIEHIKELTSWLSNNKQRIIITFEMTDNQERHYKRKAAGWV